jgi:hypothetical protein
MRARACVFVIRWRPLSSLGRVARAVGLGFMKATVLVRIDRSGAKGWNGEGNQSRFLGRHIFTAGRRQKLSR